MSLVGKKAPKFEAVAAVEGYTLDENFSLEKYIGKNEVLLFFYPKDFTFVCPTELIAFQNKIAEFEERGVVVVGCSTDTEQTHLAWLRTPRKQGGIEGVKYPIIADTDKTISSNFGVLGGSYQMAESGTFLIDKEGIVRHEVVNYFPIGRSVDEELRTIDAWQFSQKYGEVCPANWQSGDDTLKESHESVSEYLAANA
ncbi:UNVERIFIED_CONTAM: hypothetical protein GTU68_020596 [Idotea baltica]|nr:hypothetical protein [Idotea baltica]